MIMMRNRPGRRGVPEPETDEQRRVAVSATDADAARPLIFGFPAERFITVGNYAEPAPQAAEPRRWWA